MTKLGIDNLPVSENEPRAGGAGVRDLIFWLGIFLMKFPFHYTLIEMALRMCFAISKFHVEDLDSKCAYNI